MNDSSASTPMKTAAEAFAPPVAAKWTQERLEGLDRPELLNLQANAARLGEAELADVCARLLEARPRSQASRTSARGAKNQNKLVARSSAFGARGVWLRDARTSWSGIRKSDGMAVFAIWQAAIETQDGACSCLLWAPNRDGSRPWSDSVAGRERLEHCKHALERGAAEGLLVHGEAREGWLPEDRARSVLGVDAQTVVSLRIELREAEYWASWGKKRAARGGNGRSPAKRSG